MPTSPSTLNYYIGKGVVSFQPDGAGAYRDLGNVPTFEFTPDLTNLDHYSSRSGVKSKDRTVVQEKQGSVRVVLDEWTPENLALALLGTQSTNSAGEEEIDIFSENSITGMLKFVGANEVGPQITIILNKVTFNPSAALGLITDEWGQIELNGDVLIDDNGKFGTATVTAEEATA